MPINQANRDLKDKLALERKLKLDLNRLNENMVKDFKSKYADNGELISAIDYRDDLESLLLDHYEKVGGVFKTRISESLPSDILMTDEEDDKISEALSLFFLARAGEQSSRITVTNQKDITNALELGIQEEVETNEGFFSRASAAALGAAILSKRMRGRLSSIVVFETQSVAEASKATEAEVLVGIEPSITTPSVRLTSAANQEWVTVGDDKVREEHIFADGQRRKVSEPYEVGGEFLRYPGDTSLGATAGNVIGCRCSSAYDKDSIYAERRTAGEMIGEVA